MAQKTPQKKKKSTTAKKAGRKTTRSTRSKSSRSTRATKAQMERETIVREEIVILVSLAVSIILLISNFGLAGAAGRVISDFMEGLFGQMTYLFPFLLFAGVTFFLSNRGNHKAYTKLGAAVVLVALICAFLELVNRAGGSIGEKYSVRRRKRSKKPSGRSIRWREFLLIRLWRGAVRRSRSLL